MTFPMVETRCAYCGTFPCECPDLIQCACGGHIRAPHLKRDWDLLAAAVQGHNSTLRHQEWRAKRATGST